MAKRTAATRRASGGGGDVVLICSECYEEFHYNSRSDAEEIQCPVCEHASDLPEEGDLARIADLRSQEKKGMMLAFIMLTLAMTSFVGWIAVADSGMYLQPDANQDMLWWGPMGAFILFSIGNLVMTFKYEANRWEAYF